MKEITDQILFQIIDGELSKKKEAKYLDFINSDSELKSRLSYLQSFESGMRNEIELSTPSYGFKDRVMQNLHNLKYKTISVSLFDTKKWITTSTIIGGVLVGILVLTSGLIDLKFFDQGITNAIPIKQEFINLKPYLDVFTASFLFKVFLFVDLILGILIIDRAVLKPYFNRKHQPYT